MPTPDEPSALDSSRLNPQPTSVVSRSSSQLSLVQLLGMMLFVGVMLALARWIPLPIYTIVLGLVTVVMSVVFGLRPKRSLALYLSWWLTMGMYVAAALVATFKMVH